MKSGATMRLRILLALVVAALAVLVMPAAAGADIADEFGFEQFSASSLDLLNTAPEEVKEVTQAGAHPDLFVVNLKLTNYVGPSRATEPTANLKGARVELPPGLVGNPEATPKCTIAGVKDGDCPRSTVVGFHELEYNSGRGVGNWTDLVYNVVPPAGVAARFAMNVLTAQMVVFDMTLNSDGRYTVSSNVDDIPQTLQAISSRLYLLGVPAALNGAGTWKKGIGTPGGGPQIPMLSMPSRCGPQDPVKIGIESWQRQGSWVDTSYTPAEELSGCDKLSFAPTVRMRPESSEAGAPSGYSFELAVPQSESPASLATPPLRSAVVSLPEGVKISTAAAEGSAGCTDEEAALHSLAEPSCPEASRVGSVEIQTPILAGPLRGSVYLGQPKSSDSQSGEMFRLFLVASGYGVTIKQEGRITPNPVTGQLRAVFAEAPQQPFSLLKVDFKGGPRALLSNPSSCGSYATNAELTPWSAPQSGPAANVSDSFAIDRNCGAGAQFSPALRAGTANPVAGGYSPFTLRVTRPAGQQNVASIAATLPEGLLAKLAGVPLCGDAQAASGDCPADSRVGSATVGAGEGSSPIYVPQPGKAPTAVYLAGPYKGAPYSLVVKVPAQAGPFDLGTVAVRNALRVDPTSAQVTAKSDPLPQILEGVPISYRDIRVEVNRSGFTVNPTSCDPMSVTGTIGSAGGRSANVSDRFQVGDCGSLGFSPHLKLKVKGATKRGKYPALRAELRAPAGQANIGSVSVALPHSEFLAQEHIKTICTRVQYAAKQCPAGSVYGWARAWTPLLDKPLEGPVYMRSSSNPLPDLVASLDGAIHIDLAGRIDSVNGGIRTSFESVPDAPVAKFVLSMKGGKKGLLVNSRNLCAGPNRARVKMDGQNGKLHDLRPLVRNSCGKKAKKKRVTKHGRR